jgi:hypothetical protein
MEEVVLEIQRAMLPSDVDVKQVMMGQRGAAPCVVQEKALLPCKGPFEQLLYELTALPSHFVDSLPIHLLRSSYTISELLLSRFPEGSSPITIDCLLAKAL